MKRILGVYVCGLTRHPLLSVAVFVCLIIVLKRNPNIRFLLIAFFVIPPFAGLLALAVLPANSNKWGKYVTLFTLPIFAVSLFLSWSLIPSNIAGESSSVARCLTTG